MKIRIQSLIITSIYILAFIASLCFMQSTITADIVWRHNYLIIMYAIIVMCLLYIFIRKQINMSLMVLFLFVMVVYEMIASIITGLFVLPIILIDVLAWPLLIISFFLFTREYELPKAMQPITIIGFILICLESVLLLFTSFANNGSAIFATYYCIGYLPLVYLFCSKKTSFFASFVVIILMLFTMKRSAFIIVVLGISFFYFESNNIIDISKKKYKRQFVFFILLIIIGVLGQYIIRKSGLNIFNRLSSMIEDGGSGRIRIWETVFRKYRYSTVLQKIFGHGFHAVYYEVRPLGISRFAHNSFLETLYDFGLIGVAFLIFFTINLFRIFLKLREKKNELYPIMGYTLVAALVLGLVSYFFEQSVIIIPFSIIWGSCDGTLWKLEKNMVSPRFQFLNNINIFSKKG